MSGLISSGSLKGVGVAIFPTGLVIPHITELSVMEKMCQNSG